jgi:hypothetical protein
MGGSLMFNPAHLVANALAEELAQNYRDMYGDRSPEYPAILRSSAKLAIERIANSDALYHDAQHTVMVTLVGQAMLRGRVLAEKVTGADWLHFTVALLCHDIGYLRGICPGDTENSFVINEAGDTVSAPRGASDAFLTPYHVERSKIFVKHRLSLSDYLDANRIARAIELTRFPVPEGNDHADTHTEAGLLRAADLIGQLADPHYPRKLNALFHEFVETGVAERLDYRSPADLAERYPRFFWSVVEPYIRPALQHLQRTVEGKQWIAQLYAHVFVEEHVRARAGPQRGISDGPRAPDHGKAPLTSIAGAARSPDDAT